MTISALLYHGPGARQYALDQAGRVGRILHDPIGDPHKGLKVDEARLAVSLLQSVPVGEDVGVVVLGPLDRTAEKSADVLLKIVEEHDSCAVPILWAYDLGGVRPTIRSRCLSVWAPATGLEESDEQLEEVSRKLVSAYLSGRYYEVPVLVQEMKGREPDLLCETADALRAYVEDPKAMKLWERVRKTARWSNPTQIEVMVTFLPEES